MKTTALLQLCLTMTALATSCHCAHAGISATGDNFSANTSAQYNTGGGYSITYIARGNADMGDGVNDGILKVEVTQENKSGVLLYKCGTVEKSDVGKKLSLTFRVQSLRDNYHIANVSFTSDGIDIGSTTISTSTFTQWDETGTGPASPAATLGDWRKTNGEGTITYTIREEDVGTKLGWCFAAAKTSKNGGASIAIDNWKLSITR